MEIHRKEKAVALHLPDNMFRWYDGLTKSGVQGDLKDSPTVGTIFFKELNKQDENYSMTQFLKSICEEGHSETKRDIETNNRDLVTYKIPKIAGIYATTKMVDDDELINRFIVISIVGNPPLYKEVNDNTKKAFLDVNLQIEQDARRKTGTWIKYGLSEILKPVDYFEIPHIDCVKPNNETARSKRDLKRFINIACVIAWLYQQQRELQIIDGKKVLVVLPEDLLNAYNIMSKSLTQSFNNLTSRDLGTLKAIDKLAEKQSQQCLNPNESYVEKRKLQSALKIKSRGGIWKRLSSLKTNDAITVISDKENSNYWIKTNVDVISLLKGDFIELETVTCLKEFLTKPDSICFEDKDEPEPQETPTATPQQTSGEPSQKKLDIEQPLNEKIENLRNCIEMHKETLSIIELIKEGFPLEFLNKCLAEKIIFEKPDKTIGG